MKNHTTLIRIRGTIVVSELVAFVDAGLEAQITNNLLWDLRDSDVSDIGIEDLKFVSEKAVRWDDRRENPKSAAIVTPGIMETLVRLYAAVNSSGERLVPFKVFQNVDEALAWLDIAVVDASWWENPLDDS